MKIIRQNLDRLKYHKYPTILFFLLSLIPFYWLQGHPIGWGDMGIFAFFYNSNYLLDVFSYTWLSTYLSGHSAGQNISMIPFSLLFALLSSTGFSNYIQQSFAYSMILFTSMLFMYLFVYELFNYREDKKLIATISAIFYIFNPLFMIGYLYPGRLNIYVVPFISFILFLYSLILKRGKFVYILLLSIAVSLFSIVFLNPAVTIIAIMILALFFVHQIVSCDWKNLSKIKNILIYTAILTILTLLISAWFIMPLISTGREYYTAGTTIENSWHTLVIASSYLNLIDFLRLLAYGPYSGSWAYKDPTWRYIYNNNFFIFFGFLAFILILTPLLTKRKDKNILFFSLLLCIGLFLILGLNSPFGFIFEYMFKNIPYFAIFRNPIEKFIPFLLISIAALFGIGLANLYDQIRRKIGIGYGKLITIIIMLLMCGVYIFPMWTGSAVNTPITIRGNEISSFVEVPSYYQDIAEYFFNDSRDYRIFSLPLRPTTYVVFNWTYGYDGPDTIWLLYKHATISSLENNYYSSAKIISILSENLNNNLNKLAALFNIRYIVIQNDVDIIRGNYNGKVLVSQKKSKQILDKLNISYIQSFDQLELYKISDNYFVPHIYTTDKYTITDSIDSMADLVSRDSFTPGDSIIFVENILKKEEIKKLKDKEEFSKYNKILSFPLNDSSFETSIWQSTAGDCCNGNPEVANVSTTLSNDSSEGNKSLNLTSENHCACVSQVLPNLDKNSIYKINFDYKHISGTNPDFCVWDYGCNICLSEKNLDNSTEWKTYSNYLFSENCSKSANLFLYSNQPSIQESGSLFFYSNSNGKETTTNLYDNVKIEKISPLRNITNLFNDSSFENGFWREIVGDCCNGNFGEPLIYANLSSDASDGKHSLNLTSKNHCACISQVINLERNSCYNITFDYKYTSGDAPKFCLWKHELSKCNPGQILEKSSEWKTYSFTTCTQERPEVTTNLYDNVRLEKIILSDEPAYHPNITFKRTNPTRYQVKIENATEPFFLVFSESYHPDWKAYIEDKPLAFQKIIASYDNVKVKEAEHEMTFKPSDIVYLLKKPLSEDNHFTANGYANSWYLDPKEIDKDGDGNFSVTLYFKPQSYFYLGLGISLTTLTACIIYLIYNWKKQFFKEKYIKIVDSITEKRKFKYRYKTS